MIEVDNPYVCEDCPLARHERLHAPNSRQRAFLETFKHGEIQISKGELLFGQGDHAAHLFTLLEGILLRYRTLQDGRRQIVNVMFPGELIGLHGAFEEPLDHSVEALRPARLCVFQRSRFTELVSENPRLGYDVIWLAAKEGTSLEQHLVSLGQRNAKERVAYLAVWLMDRARATGLADRSNRLDFAITQTQISDMLGLSLVHTNRTIRALDQEGIVIWRAKEIHIPNFDRAAKFADYESSEMHGRPFI